MNAFSAEIVLTGGPRPSLRDTFSRKREKGHLWPIRCLTEGMKQADLRKFVPYVESRPGADWRWMGAELKTALDVEVAACRPGLVTVLGQPALPGPLGLMDWLGGFYDRAWGGRHGLVVLAIPGGIRDGRVRLNKAYNLPYTPDIAAVYLECGGRSD